MDALAKRALTYLDDRGNSGEVVLTIPRPCSAEQNGVEIWKGGYSFGPPIARDGCAVGVDFIQAFVSSLQIARGYLEGHYPDGRVQWQGRIDCGLPWHTSEQISQASPIPAEEPSEGKARGLATRDLGYRDELGRTQRVTLSVFESIAESDHSWKCGIAFDHIEGGRLRYGRGTDTIEALLDALAVARLVFESMTAKGGRFKGGCLDGGELLDCEDLPPKIDGAFWLVRDSAKSSETT